MEIIRERDYRKKGEISPFSRYSRVTPFPSNRIRHDARRSERRENSVPLGRNFGWMENGWRREARETFSSTALKFNRVPHPSCARKSEGIIQPRLDSTRDIRSSGGKGEIRQGREKSPSYFVFARFSPSRPPPPPVIGEREESSI